MTTSICVIGIRHVLCSDSIGVKDLEVLYLYLVFFSLNQNGEISLHPNLNLLIWYKKKFLMATEQNQIWPLTRKLNRRVKCRSILLSLHHFSKHTDLAYSLKDRSRVEAQLPSPLGAGGMTWSGDDTGAC